MIGQEELVTDERDSGDNRDEFMAVWKGFVTD